MHVTDASDRPAPASASVRRTALRRRANAVQRDVPGPRRRIVTRELPLPRRGGAHVAHRSPGRSRQGLEGDEPCGWRGDPSAHR